MYKQLSSFDKGMIEALKSEGWSNRRIAATLGRCESTIRHYLKRKSITGSILRREGSGRKRKTTKREDRLIERQALSDCNITIDGILKSTGLPLHRATVSKRLNEFNIKCVLQRKKPYISEANRKKRIAWCKKYENWTAEMWDNVLWSDESKFELRCQQRKRVWVCTTKPYDENALSGTVKHSKSVMIWGCFASGGIGKFYRIKGILEKTQFHKILVYQMRPSGERIFKGKQFWFQQDNDPKHTAKINKRYLMTKEKTGFLKVMDWPSQSPDLNPIENLWGILDRKLRGRAPKNEDDLYEILKSAWEELEGEKQLLRNLARSMPNRIKAVLKAKGYPTKY